jgi:hypothetical protein
MTQFYVYIYRDPSRKNEAIYVGKGQGVRSHKHLDGGSHSVLVNRRLAKMKRNGIEPIINVVDMPSEALAHQCEIDAIARFGRKDLGLGPLLNQTDGGEGTSGHSHKIETCKQMSDNNKGENNPMYGKYGENHPKFGKKATSQTRQIMSDNNRGENHPMYGKKHSPVSIQKMSNAKKGIPKQKVKCPHCNKEVAVNMATRWHFDNCKSRIHPTVS